MGNDLDNSAIGPVVPEPRINRIEEAEQCKANIDAAVLPEYRKAFRGLVHSFEACASGMIEMAMQIASLNRQVYQALRQVETLRIERDRMAAALRENHKKGRVAKGA